MPDPIELHTAGPHSPDYTRQVAAALAEAVRVLNYATRDDAPGLEQPSDVYDLLGNLRAAFEGVPQLLDQVTGWLQHASQADRLRADGVNDPGKWVDAAATHLLGARYGARNLAEGIDRAFNKVAVLKAAEDTDAS